MTQTLYAYMNKRKKKEDIAINTGGHWKKTILI
jgi:hypothetical protein